MVFRVQGLPGNMTTQIAPMMVPLLARIRTGVENMGRKYRGFKGGGRKRIFLLAALRPVVDVIKLFLEET